MWVKVVPPSLLTSHCTVGVGLPLAAALKVAVLPALANLAGRVGGHGGSEVDRQRGGIAGERPGRRGEDGLVLVAVVRGRGCEAITGRGRAGNVREVVPPSLLTSHCTVSLPLGLEVAAVKVTLVPALTVWLAGWVVTESTVSVAAVVVAELTLLVKTASY